MIELVRRLDRRRWEVHLACFRPSGAWFDRAREAAASVACFPTTSFCRADIVRHLTAFARWCRERRIAVVHTGQLYSNVFGLTGAALAGVPVRIANRREIGVIRSGGQIAAQRAAYTFAHKVIANSRAAAARLAAERVAAEKIVIVPNGLDIARFPIAPRRPMLRRFITVANLRPEKGYDVLIDAAPEVLRRFPDATFECVGAGPLFDELRAAAAARGVAHAFVFSGHQDDIAVRLANADVFVLPSYTEALPNAVLEAMAAGLPVVATDVGGVGEVVSHGRTGILVPAGDARVLAHTMAEVLANPAWAGALGDAARAEVQDRYSFDRMVSAFEDIYHAELDRRARGVAPITNPRLAAS